MRRGPILLGAGFLVLAAGAGLTFESAYRPGNDLRVSPSDEASSLALTGSAQASAPSRRPEGQKPSIETEGSGRASARQPVAPNPVDAPSEQAAVKLPPASATAPPDEPPAVPAQADEIAPHPTLPRVAVPLPPARPSPDAIREQNSLAAPLFSDVKLPSAGASRPVGFYSAGCLAGGEQLALQGPHWQVMRPSRNRNWGHPELIKFIERLAGKVAKHTDRLGILIGDMAQPRGGPLPSGHASHQVGLDVDVWLRPMPPKPYTRAEADTMAMTGVVASDNKTLNPKLWQPADAAMIKIAAQDADVERVFVNPAIKKELCRTKTTNDESWMPKVRPWYGHDDHMHVRLKCPADSPDCREQKAIPEGDGCDKSLDQWFSKGNLAIEERLKTQAPSKRHVLMRDLPIACTAVLHEPSKSRFATTGR